MTDEKKPMKITFAPGCFDNFDGTQEELDELMTKIQEMFDTGEAQAIAVPLDEIFEDLSDEDIQELLGELEDDEVPRTLH